MSSQEKVLIESFEVVFQNILKMRKKPKSKLLLQDKQFSFGWINYFWEKKKCQDVFDFFFQWFLIYKVVI